MAASFVRQVNGRASASEVEAAENMPESSKSNPGEAQANPRKLETIDGQITEVICSHAPEVILTLSGAGSQTLLHAEDISKVEQLVNGAATAKPLACAQWKDRWAKVRFAAVSGGAGQGELQSVDFQPDDTPSKR
jgi:hypothetical protein